MTKNIQLLKQVRNAAAAINQATDNPEFKALLSAADIALNTLQLQDAPAFYLQYLAQGKALLEEGRALVLKFETKPAPAVALRADLNADLRMEVLDAEIDKLHRALADVVNHLDERRSSAEKTYLVRLSAWESSLYNHHLEQAAATAEEPPRPITQAALQTYLEQKFPQWTGLKVTKFISLDGGFSKKTILFETEDAVNGKQAMVIRAEQPVDLLCYEGSDVTQEFWMIQLMRQAGLPVAELLWLEDERSHLGTRFLVSKRAEGKTYGGNLGSNEALSPELLHSILSNFIKLHNVKLSPADPLAQRSHLKEWLPFSASLRDTTRHYVTEFLPRVMRLTDIPASPQLMRGLKWLEQNIPDTGDETPVVVHIDFALNNLIIDNDRINAILDWESSRLGDPAEDIIWTQQNLAAYIDLPEFLKRYQAGTGRDISAQRLAYFKVAKCALNAITCLHAMRALNKHDAAHINLSILGYKYMALFGAQFNSLIEEAERLR